MTFISVSPKSGLPKEYPSSAEFFKEVEEVRGEPQKPPREVKTFADASKRLREQIGLDLRTLEERQEAADNEYLKEQIAEGVAEALQRQQEAQFVDGQKPFSQSPNAEKVSQSPASKPASHAPKSLNEHLADFAALTGWTPKPCSCKKAEGHKPAAAAPVIHSRRGTGPIMTAKGLTAAEAETRLKHAGITL